MVIALLALVVSAAATADGNESPEVITISGTRIGYDLDSTRSATKTDTPLLDIPQSISIITSQLIGDQGMRSMADVVRYVPGVQMAQGEGHRDAPVMRGNATTADFFVDGIRDDVQYYRDLYNAERIEVLKGPNAMMFGRGGGGGVINRVTEQANGVTERGLTLTAGEYGQQRAAMDVGQAVSDDLALRLNAMYEDSDDFREFKTVERYGMNPTATYDVSPDTSISLGYEHFDDQRTVDRGVPSVNGEPIHGVVKTFFGNPDASHSKVEINLSSATVEHAFSPTLTLRNQTLYGDYDKFYENVFPGAVTGANVSLSGYNTATQRENLFNQTNLTWETQTGSIGHTLLAGMEVSRQTTDNFRETGFFDPVANVTTISVPVANPVSRAPVYFRQTVGDADNHSTTDVAAVYFQDQVEITPQFLVIAGVRFDRFQIDFDNRRNGVALNREDNLTELRYGLIYKPISSVSLYVSRSNSYLPSSGDQFASLDATSESLKPEEFENTEFGAKWDVMPGLALTGAVYRLDRENTRAPGAAPGSIVLTGSQRSEGFEFGFAGSVTPRWELIGGYAYQDAEITSTTSAAPKGREVPLVPEHSFSLWNRYQVSTRWSAGVGIVYQDQVYAAISNAVALPSLTRVDTALFFELNDHFEAQINVENLLNEKWYATAHNDNNITPGTPRMVRATVTTHF
jgi:catecholate siderophore receptor